MVELADARASRRDSALRQEETFGSGREADLQMASIGTSTQALEASSRQV